MNYLQENSSHLEGSQVFAHDLGEGGNHEDLLCFVRWEDGNYLATLCEIQLK